ncbi:hypothetical protein [Kurthia sibirica]|uniref:Uncharacterized protein n=1 Tax=Kurthia sibirica TaxID=202750 RepID=A0A2U3AI06_9BACL|nr:hypothetical protein [Kurthia sibirica]PWI24183.1 hypothetical protein DEX24_14680 [Kurthia sibirica]GEK34803.1 hypothetical protein KSI01_23360 [Kurthia sibirica]
MENNKYLIFSVCFFIFSGLLFTLEKINWSIYWFAQVKTGSFPNYNSENILFDNLFVILFIIISIVFMLLFVFKKK